MKTIAFILIATMFGCKCSKTSTTKENGATENVNKAVASKTVTDSLASLPVCIKAMIEKMKAEPITNPPNKIYSYTFKNKTVYYVPGVCCDNFSDLYDDSCKIIAHPDGGFTGRGDGKIKDFGELRKNEKLIWEDKRKQ
jgi:hypothetical protein